MKTVIITGTGAGIGFELARIFSEKNYKVISLSRSSNVVELGLENINHMSFNITTVSYTHLTLPTNREV